MSERYTYAVARIRALETSLFSDAVIDQLIACQDYEQCLKFLSDRGWGDSALPADAETMLGREEEKIWEIVRELHIDMDRLAVLFIPRLFHNLKAAVKQVCTGETAARIFYEDVSIPGSKMLEIVKEKQFDRLPADMRTAAEEALETLLHTGDGQMCDVIIDRAALDAMERAAGESEDEIIRDYAESAVAVADIRIAVRSRKTGKPLEFMRQAMADCRSLSTEQLARAALSSSEAIGEYLRGTSYAEGADALAESPAAFERWCDNRMIQAIHPQKYKTFGIGPVVAYVIARQNEIKTVRIVLSGKRTFLPDESIRERVREMYV